MIPRPALAHPVESALGRRKARSQAMAKKNSQTMPSTSRQCTTDDVKQLGAALIDIADQYPTRFLTERDFFPLVVAYLHGRFPGVSAEHAVANGAIDFRLGGMNPSVIELAVAPRALQDAAFTDLHFPGHANAPQLYATQNKTELKKLGAMPQTKAKRRYLILLDFRAFDQGDMKAKYEEQAGKLGLKNPVCVVHVSRSATSSYTLRRRAAG